jgi:hypothetical protein
MTLTKSYQMLKQAYLGSSYGDLYIRIYAKYSEQDETNLTSTVQYQARAYFSGNYIYDASSNGTVSGTGATSSNYSKSSNYTNGETVLGTITGTVHHNAETGEASITASASLNFPNWSWSNTATGTADLPIIETSTLRLRVNNAWVKATPYLRVNGAWVKCKAYLGVNGNWTKGV